MKTFKLFLVLFLMSSLSLTAQSARKVLVEHFTNTRCSICASRNPTFYSTLNARPDVLHLAFHPSAPYANCLLSSQNPTENDARTNYYGVYGSTPRVVVQGRVLNPANPILPTAAVDTLQGGTTAVALSLMPMFTGTNEVTVRAVIRTTGVTGYTNLNLFIGLTEDTIFYNAPNGENRHYDVFRKAFFAGNGLAITLPALGDSLVITETVSIPAAAINSRLSTIGFIQHQPSKYILNAEKAAVGMPTTTGTSQPRVVTEVNLVYPNPNSDNQIFINNSLQLATVSVYNALGQLVYSANNRFDASLSMPQSGLYIVQAQTQTGEYLVQKLIVQ